MDITKQIIGTLSNLELYDHTGEVEEELDGKLRLFVAYKMTVDDNSSLPCYDSPDGIRDGNIYLSIDITDVSLLDVNYEEIEITYDEEEVLTKLNKIL